MSGHAFTGVVPSPVPAPPTAPAFTDEDARNIYSNSLELVNFINNHVVKDNLPSDTFEEVRSRVEILERMVRDLSLSGTTLDLSPLNNAINTGKAFTAASSTVPAPGFAGTPPSSAPGFTDPGFTGTPPSSAPGFTDPGFAGTPPSSAPGFADPGFTDPGFAGTPPSSAPGFVDPGFVDPGFAGTPPSPAPGPGTAAPELTDLQALNYIASNNDLITSIGTDIQAAKSHYRDFGFNEGRNLNLFSASSYLEIYPDLKNVFGSDLDKALKHYIQDGFREGRNVPLAAPGFAGTPPSSAPGAVPAPELTDFQALNYIASNSDLISAIGTDIEAAKSHYRNFGKVEGRVLDDFDEWGYLASNNDLLTNIGGDPTEAVKNYISFGKSEGRSTNIFNADSYLNNYADLKNAFGSDLTLATKHYVENGFNEGRVF